MKIDDVIARVRAEIDRAFMDGGIPPIDHRFIVRATLSAVDLHISDDGEIYSPAPPPSLVIPTVPAMNNLRFGGRKRRR